MFLILKAILHALRDLLRLKIAWIIAWPILVATFFWLTVGYIFQDGFSELTYQWFDFLGVGEWLKNIKSDWVAISIQGLLHIFIFVPLVIITTLIITAIFLMPALIKLVSDRYYPQLKRHNGGSIGGSIINAVLASGTFILIWIITLPLWAVGAGVIIPFIAVAFMNQQLFRYDALSEHATKQEIKKICSSSRYSLWGLGLLTGFIQFVPFLNLLAPVFTALAFIHFGLDHLQVLRAENKQNHPFLK